MQTKTKSALLFAGPSQAGKSSVINLLMGGDVAAVGRGDGRSVTSWATTYPTRIGLVQEIPGTVQISLDWVHGPVIDELLHYC